MTPTRKQAPKPHFPKQAAALAATLLCTSAGATDLVVDSDTTISTSATYGTIRIAANSTLTIAADTTVTGRIEADGCSPTIEVKAVLALTSLLATNGASVAVVFNGGYIGEVDQDFRGWFNIASDSAVDLTAVTPNQIGFVNQIGYGKRLKDGLGRLTTSGDVGAAFRPNASAPFDLAGIASADWGNGRATFSGTASGTTGYVWAPDDNVLPPTVFLGSTVVGANGVLDISREQQPATMTGWWWAYRNPYAGVGGASTQTLWKVSHDGSGYEGSYITNRSANAGTLVFERDGALLDAKLSGMIDVVKKGADSTMTSQTHAMNRLAVDGGTLVVRAPSGYDTVTCETLTVADGATVVVDGCTLLAGSLSNSGTIEKVNGGELQVVREIDVSAGASSTLDVSEMDAVVTYRKTGAGTLTIVSDNHAAAPFKDFHVASGTLALADKGTLDTFWRFTVKQTFTPGYPLMLSGVRLLSWNGSAYEHADGGRSYTKVEGKADSELGVREIKTTGTVTGNVSLETAMFGIGWNDPCSFSDTPTIGNSPSWVVITYRIPSPSHAVRGYDLHGSWTQPAYNAPAAWEWESSADGIEWTVLDEKSSQPFSAGVWQHSQGNYDNPSQDPYPFDVAMAPSAGFASAASGVQVDQGAMLDCSRVDGGQELSAITIDMASGGGTLRNVRLADSGMVYLLNVSDAGALDTLPLAFVDSDTSGRLGDWTVVINGVETGRTLVWSSGALVIGKKGTVVVFR